MKQNLILIAIVTFLFMGCVPYIDPIETNPIGKTYQGSINFRNMELPLPEGEWVVVGRGYRYSENYVEIILFNQKTQDAVYIKRDSLNNSYTGYLANKYMSREDLHHKVVKNNQVGGAQDGWLINHYRLSLNPKSGQATRESYDYIVNNNYSLPGNFIQVLHRFTGDKMQPKKLLEYSCFFNPETDGFAPPANSEWASSDWYKLKINSDPKKGEYIEMLKKDGEVMHEKLRIAFGN